MRWLAYMTRIRIGTFSTIGASVLLPVLQCKNDVTFDIHIWVRLNFYTQIYTQKLKWRKVFRKIQFYPASWIVYDYQ